MLASLSVRGEDVAEVVGSGGQVGWTVTWVPGERSPQGWGGLGGRRPGGLATQSKGLGEGWCRQGPRGDRSEGQENEMWDGGGHGSGVPGLSQRVEHVT